MNAFRTALPAPPRPRLYRVTYRGRVYLLTASQLAQARARIAAQQHPPAQSKPVVPRPAPPSSVSVSPLLPRVPVPEGLAPVVEAGQTIYRDASAAAGILGAAGVGSGTIGSAASALAPLAAGAAAVVMPLAAVGVIVASIVGAKSKEQLLAEAIANGQEAMNAAGRAGTDRLQDDTRVVNAGGQRSRTNILGIVAES